MNKLLLKLAFPVCALLLGAALYTACKDDMEGKEFLVSDKLAMDDYIIQKDQTMEAFLEIVDKSGFRGTVHAYGTYTFFVPTNSAVEEYLSEKNTSIAALTREQCMDIVKFHIVEEVFKTEDFIDGRLPYPTMLKKYLTTRTAPDQGNVVEVNRQAIILKRDIEVINGLIHKIDKVMYPNPLTAGEQVEQLPDNEYSLFKEVLRETGWIDSIKVNNDSTWYTVFLQSNESLAKAVDTVKLNLPNGIKTRADLVAYLRANAGLDALLRDDELLHSYASYLCAKGLYYVADLANAGVLMTHAVNQTITVKRDRDTLLINEFGDKRSRDFEKGTAVDKESQYTDFSCFNGVLIDMKGYIGPKMRGPRALYWDVAEQPELFKNPRFRRGGISITQEEGLAFSEMTPVLRAGQPLQISYAHFGSYDPRFALVYQDGLSINWTRLQSLTFKLPVLNPGTYKVWVCYRRADLTDVGVRGIFKQDGEEDQPLNVMCFTDYISTDTDPEVLLVAGWKRFTAKERSSTMASILAGTIVVQSTGRHSFTFSVVRPGRSEVMWLDMIHFIPIGEDELWPRFDMMGNQVYPEDCCEDIYPKAVACDANSRCN